MLDAYRTPGLDVAAHLRASAGVAILPFGALEAHGPHLPLGTDTAAAIEIARRVAERVDAVLLPPVHYGETWLTSGYPGTVSLAPTTVTAIAVDIGRALAASGARIFAIVNGDFGNREPLQAAIRILTEEATITAAVLDYPGMDEAIAAVREASPAAAGLNHAEEAETSTMLAIDPETVRVDRYVIEYPDFPADFGTRPMRLHEFSASGVFGDPTRATAAKGEQIIQATVDGCVAAITRMLPG
jgi:creatinine amidohydrolase